MTPELFAENERMATICENVDFCHFPFHFFSGFRSDPIVMNVGRMGSTLGNFLGPTLGDYVRRCCNRRSVEYD